jgi:hypothetical protein
LVVQNDIMIPGQRQARRGGNKISERIINHFKAATIGGEKKAEED